MSSPWKNNKSVCVFVAELGVAAKTKLSHKKILKQFSTRISYTSPKNCGFYIKFSFFSKEKVMKQLIKKIFQLKKIIQSFFHEKGKSIMISCFTQGEELLTQSTDFDMIFSADRNHIVRAKSFLFCTVMQ